MRDTSKINQKERAYTVRGLGVSEPGHRYIPRRPNRLIAEVPATAVVVEEQVLAAKIPRPVRYVSNIRPAHPRQNRSLVLHRQAVNKVTYAEPRAYAPQLAVKHARRLNPALVFGMAAVGSFALVFGGGLLLMHVRPVHLASSGPLTLGAVTNQPHASSTDKPSRAELAAYKVAPGEPRFLKIPKLELVARITHSDTGPNGLPAWPANIFDAAWSHQGVRAGSNGVVVLGGQMGVRNALFNALDSLGQGDVVQIEQGDGAIFSYKVTKVEKYNADKLTAEVVSRPAVAGKGGLNLVVLNGRYNPKTSQYEQQVLVRAALQ